MARLSFERYPDVFTPSSPVTIRDLFVGRDDELFRLTKAITRGQHALVYGERGIGKTSLTAVALRGKSNVIPLICSDSWTFSEFARQVLSSLGKPTTVVETKKSASKKRSPKLDLKLAQYGTEYQEDESLTEKGIADASWSASSLVHELRGNCAESTVVMDEYDLLPKDSGFHKELSVFMKVTAEHHAELPITFVVVGIASSAAELLAGHESSARALEQIFLKYISRDAMTEFLHKAEAALPIRFDSTVVQRLVNGSFGYPYYAHLICESILDDISQRGLNEDHITGEFYRAGLRRAISAKYKDFLARYGGGLRKVRQSPEVLLKWLCLRHDQGIRRTDDATRRLIRTGELSETEVGRAAEFVTQSQFPISIGKRFINVRDPMFLPCLRKYYFGDHPPTIEGPEQGHLF